MSRPLAGLIAPHSGKPAPVAANLAQGPANTAATATFTSLLQDSQPAPGAPDAPGAEAPARGAPADPVTAEGALSAVALLAAPPADAAPAAPQPGPASIEPGPIPLAGLTPAEGAAPVRPSDAPAPLAPTQPPVTAEAMARQVAEQIVGLGTDRAEVQLSTAELGRLRFEITQRGEAVQIVVTAERAETLDLLRRNGEQLLSELRTMGFSGGELNFGAWGGQARTAAPPPPLEADSQAATEPAPVAPSAARAPARAEGRGLDLRL